LPSCWGGYLVKIDLYNHLVANGLTRRGLLKGGASVAALAAVGGTLPYGTASAGGHGPLRAEILKIPGVGMGSPTDADWQKVGALCLGPTKERVAEGELKGVELTFMGLNNQNVHNILFRGFLKPWEAYTGAKINWIDLAQADYNARLQQSIATGTVDFDILEMGAPFEGDTAGRGLLNEMPGWVGEQIDTKDVVSYLRPPVGTWAGKTYRVTIDGDCHTFAYRKDYFGDGGIGGAEVPKTWQEVNAVTKALVGKTDPLTGLDAHGFLDPLKGWGGFGFYFIEDRAAAYAKHPNDPAWLFDPDTMKPRVNNPAWVQAIQDVMDLIATDGAYPADQINADPGTTAFQQFLAGTGSMLTWWGDVGSSARTSDTSVVGDVIGFGINRGSDRVYNSQTGAWENTYNEAPNMAYIGWGIYVTNRVQGDDKKHKAAWSAAAHLGGKDLTVIPISSTTSGSKRATTGLSLKTTLAPMQTAIITRTQQLSLEFLAFSSTTRWPRTSSPKALPVSMARPRKPPMRLQRRGSGLLIRLAEKAKLRFTGCRWVCDLSL
jgi:multiple sugar transport system substrate-binding protein